MDSENQKQLGKYYTVSNPFSLKIFRKWFNKIPNISDLTILEPFAGSNNIVRLMDVNNRWNCFDILLTTNLVPEFPIMQRDTIEDFPIGYKLCITNPPYLAKNSATRRGGSIIRWIKYTFKEETDPNVVKEIIAEQLRLRKL